MTLQHATPSVGYSILRSGEGNAFEACIVTPHIERPRKIAFDPISRRLDIVAGVASMSLPEIPPDIAHLLTNAPDRLILVTTDSLSIVRFSSRAGDLLACLQ